MASEKASSSKGLTKNVRWVIIALVIQFFGGIVLGALGKPEPGDPLWKNIISYSVVTVHVLVGILLIGLVIMLFRQSLKLSDKPLKTKLQYGFYTSVLSFISGVLTVTVKSLEELFTLLMAAFFMLALVAYGSAYVSLNSTKTSS